MQIEDNTKKMQFFFIVDSSKEDTFAEKTKHKKSRGNF